jgi:hypothetical protein
MSFYAHISSDLSFDYFRQNNPSSFTVKLPHKIKLDTDQYELAVTDMSFINNFLTFPNDHDRRLSFKINHVKSAIIQIFHTRLLMKL